MSLENQPNLGRTIASLRASHGLSQEELAARCGVHTNTIKDLENSQDPNPRLKTLRAVSQSFGITIVGLLRGQSTEGPISIPPASTSLIASHSIKCLIPRFHSTLITGEPIEIIVDVSTNGSRGVSCPYLDRENGKCQVIINENRRYDHIQQRTKIEETCLYLEPKSLTVTP